MALMSGVNVVMDVPDNSSLYRSAGGYQQVLDHYVQCLQELEIPTETCYVDSSFGSTHVILSGNETGKALVFWHGLNANATTWLSWFPHFVPNYRLYAVDLIGAMGKSAPARPSKKDSSYGLWAAEVLRGLGLQQANMIGASNGGWLIGKLAGVAPELIGSAVLMSTAGFSGLNWWQTLRMLPSMLKSPAEAARQVAATVSPPGAAPDPFYLQFFELMLTSRFISELSGPLLTDTEIQQLTAPTYLLMGQYESLVNPYKTLQRGLQLLSNLVLAEIVPGVGHSMIHRRPDWVTGRVLSFFSRYAI